MRTRASLAELTDVHPHPTSYFGFPFSLGQSWGNLALLLLSSVVRRRRRPGGVRILDRLPNATSRSLPNFDLSLVQICG